MKQLKRFVGALATLVAGACLISPSFHAMPRFMDRFDLDPTAKAEMKGKCNVCHVVDDGYGPLNAFGKAFAEGGYRITEGLRGRSPELFAGGPGGTAPQAPVFDVKAFYEKNCATCHGADGKGGESRLVAPNFQDAAWQKRRTDQNLINSITKGKGAMPAWNEKLTEEQIKAMAAWVRKFSAQ